MFAETAAVTAAPNDPDPSVRDLWSLPWVSIDNDDSRDLDQLSVAQPVSDGVRKILVAVADVDAVVFFGSARLRPDGPLGRYYTEKSRSSRGS